jgi:hypothetical protein
MLESFIKKTNLNDIGIILIASFAIVAFWRGTWNLMDKFLFPNNFVLSQFISIGIGLLILGILSKIK